MTIYTFMVPVLGEHSETLVNAIHCSRNPASAWFAWMMNGTQPDPSLDSECDISPLEENSALAKTLNVFGTPTIFLENGERIGGFVPAETLVERMNAAKQK